MFVCPTTLFDRLRGYAVHLAGWTSARPQRVMVVDDDEATRRFVERVLRDAGFDTAAAADGLEALVLAREGAPLDLVLTDVMMPGMTGDELARRLRKIEPTVKVLYLTGHSDELFKDRSSLWEDEAYLDKPCSATSLLQAVSLLTTGRLRPHRPQGDAGVAVPATDDTIGSAC